MKNRLIVLLGFFGLIGGAIAQTYVESRADKNASWKPYPVEQFSDITDFTPQSVTLNKYGSNTAYRSTATGFFRAEEIDGRWFIIDPEGYTFIHKGVACVAPGTSDNNKTAVIEKWGTNSAWCAYTNQWLKDNGFNGAGAWSDQSLLRNQAEPVVYTVIAHPMSNYRNYHKNQVGGYNNAGWQGYEYNIIRVFDPLFKTYLNNSCKNFAQYKDDKYLLGYFIDNELPWVNDALDRHIRYLAKDDPCYIAAKEWLDARKGKDATLSDITQDDRNAFWDYYAGTFFSLAKEYIERYDPNHMFLGSRFNQGGEELSNPYIFETAGKYCDIISINHYREWEPVADRMASWESWAKKPFIITEFYTKGEDSGLLNDTGAGWLVKTQTDRGLFYENFIIQLLRSKGCVGWHWFRYQDNDPEDLTTDPSNRDSNKGLVKTNYDPYDDLMSICKTTNENVYSFLDYLKGNASDEQIIFQPIADTYLRLMDTETTVHGKEDILRVKNSNGTTYERTSFLQFDFTPYLNDLSRIKQIRFGIRLMNVYPEANDPASVTMTAYRVTNMEINENTPNNQLFTAYPGRNETIIGNVPVTVSTSSKDKFFEIDLASLLSVISDNPLITIRLQMNLETATQFEFASKDNADADSRPYVKMTMTGSVNAEKQVQFIPQTTVYKSGNSLVVEGIEKDSLISFYNISGQCIYKEKNMTENRLIFPIRDSWGKFLLVNIISDKTNETIKVCM